MEACMWRSFYFVFIYEEERIANVRTVKAGRIAKERIAKERIVKAGNINERTSSACPQKMKSLGMGKENSVPCPQKMKSVGM